MDKETAIRVENISKTFRIPHEKISTLKGAFVSAFHSNGYEEFKALDDVSFEVKKGEFFGIIGRNGSGKSTLLKILAGIYKPDKGGKININGRISPFLELGIGFNPELSGRDNVYLNAAVLGLSHKQIEEKFDDIVEFSELRRFIDQKVKNYSSGMQVRLAFSVAIHANRDILLMDEVLAVGDMNFQSKCMEEFNKYKDQGKTVILVTHDMATVQRYCDRAMLLRNGKIEMIGKSEIVGNKYIEQNIIDEEKIISEKDKSLTPRNIRMRNTGKSNEITGVEFVCGDNQSKHVFKTGDLIRTRVNFDCEKNKEINFTLALFNQDGNYIFGISSFIDQVDTKKCAERGYFEVEFKNIPLKTNSYYVQAGLWGERESIMLDYFSKSKFFKIYSDSQNQGICELEHKWN